jgi:hypothetical protein
MKVNIDLILLELDSYLPEYQNQISLQCVEGNPDPFYGIGRITDLDHEEKDFVEPIFKDLAYTNTIIKKLGMYRTRVMRMPPQTCYTYHRDYTQRMHIPLITNERCFFVIDDEVSRYPADGSYYLINTTKKHTFVNASTEYRIHIVGCING